MKRCVGNGRGEVVSNAVTNCLIIFKGTAKNAVDLHMGASSGNVLSYPGEA